jgi:hypothetical protein
VADSAKSVEAGAARAAQAGAAQASAAPGGGAEAVRAAPASAAAQRRVPDFFIVGHAKCGTTALYAILRSHPQIYMPDVKEPRFFAPELLSRFREQGAEDSPEPAVNRHRYSLEAYLDLFAAADPEQRAGEASPIYLRSMTAAARIAEVQPHARIIAIVREPASFLRSLHLQNVQNHLESERDFGKALALEGSRREGRNIPPRCHSPEALMYSDHVRYVEQLRRFRDVFGAEQMLVLIYDDFRRDNEASARAVLRLLEVDDTAELEAVETKPLRAVRNPRLHGVRQTLWRARHNPAAAGRLSRTVAALTPEQLRSGTGRSLWRRFVYSDPAPPDEALMLAIRRRFKGEVVALSEYLDRDLVALWGYDRIS